ncbi:hypothetical protein KIN20_011089 [Parelaphostrongylus tenuis]|uniref:Uncharacterized protein n=1 Tax=Parelaphostrongylus tenuis TaxID=148309 RepID=A0AAD5MUX2_PARTN|nr:hypothetical protein KIN20_011089 [Parelaphostrongylus tenuis]
MGLYRKKFIQYDGVPHVSLTFALTALSVGAWLPELFGRMKSMTSQFGKHNIGQTSNFENAMGSQNARNARNKAISAVKPHSFTINEADRTHSQPTEMDKKTDWKAVKMAGIVTFLSAVENTVVSMSEWPYMHTNGIFSSRIRDTGHRD